MSTTRSRSFIVPDSFDDLEDESGTIKLKVDFDIDTGVIESKSIDKEMDIDFEKSVKQEDATESVIRIIETKKNKNKPLW
jgi:hypothetical protein|uniref:Uncharacterized protein n=1 Tax=Ackermannviridae sp. TaxID=2831612 RepID=A0A8S5VU05_9CAUD|nr:MAG TPA: hypothetical protein [Ackermannviridae sp.]